MNRSISTTMTGKTKIKIVLLGNQGVGKSSIIQKYVKDQFDQSSNPTVGIDFLVKNVTHQAQAYRLQLWDTAGQQRFRSLIPNYLKDAKCAIIVVDVTNRASLNGAQGWLKLYTQNRNGEGSAFLVGNKIDLEYREVNEEEARKKAQELGLGYMEISAKTGKFIQELFLTVIDKYENREPAPVTKQSKIKDSEVIKEEDNMQEEETEVKEKKRGKITVSKEQINQTDTKMMEDSKKEEKPCENIVLKNEKIEKKGEKAQKGCCS